MPMHEYRFEVIIQASKEFVYPFKECPVKDKLREHLSDWLDNFSFISGQPEKLIEVTLLEYTENIKTK